MNPVRAECEVVHTYVDRSGSAFGAVLAATRSSRDPPKIAAHYGADTSKPTPIEQQRGGYTAQHAHDV